MKKCLLLTGAVLLFLISLSLSAEGSDFGYISSITIPFYSGSGWEDYRDSLLEQDSTLLSAEGNPLIGVSLGIISELPLNTAFSLRSALILSASGGGYVTTSQDKDRSSHLLTEYNLEIPLFLKWQYIPLSPGLLYLIGGPQISILLYQQEFKQIGAVFDHRSLDRDMFQPIGFGFAGGLGMDVPQDNYTIYLEMMFLREISSSFKSFKKVYQTAVNFNTGIRWKRSER